MLKDALHSVILRALRADVVDGRVLLKQIDGQALAHRLGGGWMSRPLTPAQALILWREAGSAWEPMGREIAVWLRRCLQLRAQRSLLVSSG